jgi:hypothetical protein
MLMNVTVYTYDIHVHWDVYDDMLELVVEHLVMVL